MDLESSIAPDNTVVPGVYQSYEAYTRPIVEFWEGALRRGREAKAEFTLRGEQVESFYSGGAGAMWEPKYLDKFMGGGAGFTAPKFKITMNVAFEQVAVLGPLLFWEMANRKVRPHRSLQLDPSVLSSGNPEIEQYFQQLAQQQAGDDARATMRAQILEHMLNYFQYEQPGGGLGNHSNYAIFEALTKGAGFLRTDHYQFPASEKVFVGSFFESVDNVLVDPDCQDPLWQKARWVAIRHRNKYYEVETHFGLRPGTLRNYATLATPNAAYQAGGITNKPNEKAERDLVEWYEVFSKAGFGNALSGTTMKIEPEFDEARGDGFAYLCICPGCPYPLNLTAESLAADYADAEYIKSQTNWPTEFWRDNKWPITKLDFYPHNGTSAWPEPPLAPAIGELTILNILISAYVQCAYDRRQEIIGVMKGAVDDLQGLIQSNKSPLVLELLPDIHKTVNDVISFMQRPEVNKDLPQTIEFIMSLIEKRTGLSDMLYGRNPGANPRSATEYQGKLDTVNIRPEHMQKKIAAFESDVADHEIICLYYHVTSDDIAEQLGPLGVAAWDELVTNENPESILRGCNAVVEASEIRRPNKAKDTADMQNLSQTLLPIIANEMAQTGDVGPMNGFIEAYGDASEIDVRPFLFPEKGPDEAAQQMQQLQMQQVAADVEKTKADADKSRAQAQQALQANDQSERNSMIKMATAEHAANLKQQTAEQQMQLKQDQHQQQMQHRDQQARQALALRLFDASQKSNQAASNHAQAQGLANDKARQEAQRGNMITYSKMVNSGLMHRQKMQQSQQTQG